MEDMILATDVSRNKDFMTQFEVSVCICNTTVIKKAFVVRFCVTSLWRDPWLTRVPIGVLFTKHSSSPIEQRPPLLLDLSVSNYTQWQAVYTIPRNMLLYILCPLQTL